MARTRTQDVTCAAFVSSATVLLLRQFRYFSENTENKKGQFCDADNKYGDDMCQDSVTEWLR